jgi:hypothetical protein
MSKHIQPHKWPTKFPARKREKGLAGRKAQVLQMDFAESFPCSLNPTNSLTAALEATNPVVMELALLENGQFCESLE